MTQPPEERRARGVEGRRRAGGRDEVVDQTGDGLASEDDGIATRRHPVTADRGDRIVHGDPAWRAGEILAAGGGRRRVGCVEWFPASLPGSPVKPSSRVPADQPEPFASRASTIAVTKDVI